MNEVGFFFFVTYIVAMFSTPFVLFAILMRLVGRISINAIIIIIILDSILWAMGAVYLWTVSAH